MNVTSKFFVILLAVLSPLAASLCNAQDKDDHLKPADGFFSLYDFQAEYYAHLREKLFNGLSDSYIVRLVTLPSFNPENVLQIEEDHSTGKRYCVYHICEPMLWSKKEQWKDVEVKKFRKELERESSELFYKLYELAISQASYFEEDGVMLDGTRYFLSTGLRQNRTGMVVSPPKNSRMAELIAVSEELIKLVANATTPAPLTFAAPYRDRLAKLTNTLTAK